MKFGAWLAKQIAEGRWKNKRDACQALSEGIAASGNGKVSRVTIENAAMGQRLVKYEKAKALSDATCGAVTIQDLCEE